MNVRISDGPNCEKTEKLARMKLTSEKIDGIVLGVRVLTHSFQPKTRATGETR